MLSFLKFNRIILLVCLSTLTIFFFLSSVSFAASVTLAWDRSNDEAVKGYHVYYGLSGTDYKASPGITINSADETQCEIDDLEPGEVYVFAATSHDGNGFESDFSQEIYYTVPVSATASVTLAWDRSNDEAVKGYHVYYGLSGTDYKANPGKTINSADETQCEIDDLKPGEVYVFAATSHDGNGFESDFSEEIYYTVPVSNSLYSIEVSVLPSQTGSIRSSSGNMDCRDNCSAEFESGSSPMFSIEPDNAYRIADVKVNGSSVGIISSYTFDNISGPQTIEASFALKNYTVTATAGAGGAIDPSGELSVTHGDSATFVIAASEGYKISDVIVNGSHIGPVPEYTFSNIASDQSIAASFSKKSYTITSSAGAGGAISPVGDTIVSHGGSASYGIAAIDGYEIADVKVNGSSIGPVSSYTFSNVTSDGSISASFKAVNYTITASAGAGGSIAPAGDTEVSQGGSVAYTITADNGYEIADVKVNGSSIGPVSSYTFSNVTSDGSISASFKAVNYTITASAGAGGSIAPSGDTEVSQGGSVAYTITADNGYEIIDVKVNGSSIGPGQQLHLLQCHQRRFHKRFF
jgi:hypothetical protein